jgi:hypothetical protein
VRRGREGKTDFVKSSLASVQPYQAPRRPRPPTTPPHQTRGPKLASGAEAPSTPTTLAVATDVDTGELKRLSTRLFSIQQSKLKSIWPSLFIRVPPHPFLFTYQIIALFCASAFDFCPNPFAHAGCPKPTRPSPLSASPRKNCLSKLPCLLPIYNHVPPSGGYAKKNITSAPN